MFSTRLTRVAHRASTAAAACNSTSSTAQRTTSCLASRSRPSPHQRRPSSSKATPPDSSQKLAPAAKATCASSGENASQSPASAPSSSRTKRVGRLRRPSIEKPVKKQEVADQFAGLPAVPAILHLDGKDLQTSSFFSLHRPLSLTTTIPPIAADDTFASIFNFQAQRDPWADGNSAERRPEDVIYTLHNTIESLENGAQSNQEEGVRWEVIQESPSNSDGVKHLDGPPKMKSLDELVAQFKPFRAPPPPEPFPEEPKQVDKKKMSAKAKQAARQKSYTTTIVVTESMSPDGQRTYTASSSPIVRLPDVEDAGQQSSIQDPSPQRRPRQPFLERMRRRQQAYLHAQHQRILERDGSRQRTIRRAPSQRRVQMLLISVKRQRKLKMKKHKYKKLMKRTRNLRRRLDRT